MNELEKKLQKNSFYGINEKGEETPLHLAAIFGSVEDVKALIESGANVNTADHEGYTPLHLASMMSCTGKVRALINAGAKVNAKDHIGRTPLHQAVIMGELKNIRAILEAGGDIYSIDHNGHTPIDLAYMTDIKKIVKELTSYSTGRVFTNLAVH